MYFLFLFCLIFAVAGTIVETGSIIQAVVLDVAKAEHLVDLSLKPEFVNNLKQESSKSQTRTKVKCIPGYL